MNKTLQVLIITIIAVGIVSGLALASGFNVGQIRFVINVEEPIHCEPACDGEGDDIHLNLFPGEEQTVEIQVFNRSDKNLDVEFRANCTPDSDDLQVTLPDIFLVPGDGSSVQRIFLRAAERTEPQEYKCVLSVDRGEY